MTSRGQRKKQRARSQSAPPRQQGADKPQGHVAKPSPASPARTADDIETLSVSARWSGPLPAPADLAAFDEIIPNGAERILAMAESQSQHRQDMERIYVENQTTTERRGQVMAFALGTLGILVGGGLVFTDHDGAGFATIIAAVASLVGINVFSRIIERRELDERREEDRQLQLDLPEGL